MKIEFEANNRTVRLGRSMEISFQDDARDKVRYRLTKSAVRKALLGLRAGQCRRIVYRDLEYPVPIRRRTGVTMFGTNGFHFGCQYFDRTQANLIRKWVGVPVR